MKEEYLAETSQGGILAGTGASSTAKHLAEIERHNLQAVCANGGYIVNGTLSWVSSIGEKHIWANIA